MGSWHPNDLVTDQDLADYESTILTKFGQFTWESKRTKALEDWLFPILRGAGFDPQQLRTRFDATQVTGYTGSAYTDLTGAAQNATTDDVNLATIFATPATDALYVGSSEPFRGLFLKLLDSVSAVTATLSAAYWSGTWKSLAISDRTVAVSGKALSGGGSVVWTLPPDWVTRAVNGSDARYWVKVSVSAVPTGAKASQIGVIRTSVLRAPLAFRTLALIMREAVTSSDGPWKEKADYYADQAAESLERALPLVGGEFDTDADDLVDATEATQTSTEASGGGWRLERG